MKALITNSIRKVTEVGFSGIFGRLIDDIKWDAIAHHHLAALRPASYVPWTRPALSPRAVATILNDIVINNRTHIVELGSGVSTIYIASLLRSLGDDRQFVSVEDNEQWMQTISGILNREELSNYVNFVLAPHAECDLSLNPPSSWYDKKILQAEIKLPFIDCLVVDGPSGDGDDMGIRYPALPVFFEYLGERYFVALDDAKRKGEKAVLARWQQDYGLKFKLTGELAYAVQGQFFKPLV